LDQPDHPGALLASGPVAFGYFDSRISRPFAGCFPDPQGTPRSVVDLYGVSIVENVEWNGAAIDLSAG